jgi:hypothetical protein
MAAAAFSNVLCVPEDVPSLQDRVHELETRVHIIAPILSIFFEREIEKEKAPLPQLKQQYALACLMQTHAETIYQFYKSSKVDEARAYFEKAKVEMKERGWGEIYAPRGLSTLHDPILDILNLILSWAVVMSVQYHQANPFDIIKSYEGLKKSVEELKERYEKQQALVDSLLTQSAALMPERERRREEERRRKEEEEWRRKKEEAERKEAQRRELEAQMAALAAQLKALSA